MAGLIDLLKQELSGDAVQQLSNHIGADPQATRSALAAAVPAVLGGMSQTAQQPGGEETINQAAQQHAGALGNFGSLLNRTPADLSPDHGGLLGRVLGQQQPQVQNTVAQASGLGQDQVKRVLMAVAPLALAALMQQRNRAQSQGQATGLGQILQEGHAAAQQGGLGGLLGHLL